MSRLTIRKNDIALIEEIEYEPCGEVCDRTSCFDCPIGKVVEKLAHYEDLEEQGRLIELPCKVGTPTWMITWELDESGDEYHYVTPTKFDLEDVEDWGTIFFLTKEEAEAKLAELKGAEE